VDIVLAGAPADAYLEYVEHEDFALPPYEVLVARIDDATEMVGMRKKDVAEAVGLSPSQFSDKRQARNNRFTLEEVIRLHGFFQAKLGRPIPYWPFMSLDEATAYGALLRVNDTR
jgi:hypothetical protein